MWPLTFFIFLVQKIIWLSDYPMFISPHCVIYAFVFVSMWLIRVGVLGVTLDIDFIICKAKSFTNFRYFFLFQIILYLHLLLCSYFLLLIFNHSNISLFSDTPVYVIFRLSYWWSLSCLTVFLETLFDLEISESLIELCIFVSIMLITVGFDVFTSFLSSSIFGSKLYPNV